jgi:hypothetical protein
VCNATLAGQFLNVHHCTIGDATVHVDPYAAFALFFFRGLLFSAEQEGLRKRCGSASGETQGIKP